ncbi:hypothetical protein T439DRAFT_321862 [Meredithblackwellia eburnea MCA 4105]
MMVPRAGQDDQGARLQKIVKPEYYQITLKTDLKTSTFSGSAEIKLELSHSLPPATPIVLNLAHPLKLNKALLALPTSDTSSTSPTTKIKSSEIKVIEDKERVELYFDKTKETPKGKATIALSWSGQLNGSMKGYYLSLYPSKTGSGSDHYAVTQFQPTHARRAFPCFDEPCFKAIFQISMISRSSTVSLCNTAMESVESLGALGAFPRSELLSDEFFDFDTGAYSSNISSSSPSTGVKDTWELVRFLPTPPMSSYIVAFANGDFLRNASSINDVDLAFYATWDNIAQTSYALDLTARVLPVYERLFEIKYPLRKLDTLVVSDFDLGAMENLGLITGRTSVYMFDEKKNGISAKKRVASTASHEISHQWFGNLVTMEWWDNLWLNEAFATFVGEVIMMEEIEPSWKASSSFVSGHLSRALSLDALRSSHPIEMPCPDEDTIVSIFDAISYSKGASVLNMLASMVGKDIFLKGVALYLKSHLYGNAKTADLWAGIAKTSGQDIVGIMEEWTTKIGFPVISVKETAKGLVVRQNRFLSTGDPSPEEDETLWKIPLSLLRVVDGRAVVDRDLLLTTREVVVPVDGSTDFKFNFGTSGVYRVLYEPERLVKLGELAAQKNSALSTNDRMGLVQDAMVLASSGYSITSGALNLISKVSGETENLVLGSIRLALGQLGGSWWEQPKGDRDGIRAFGLTIFAPIAHKLGLDYSSDEDTEVTELRTLSVSYAADCGDSKVLAEYKKRFQLFKTSNDESGIPSDLRASIYSDAVSRGDVSDYETVLEVYRKAPTPAHKSAAIAALGSTEDESLLDRTLALILSSEVKTQDISAFLYSIGGNPLRRKLWSFFKEHYHEFITRFKGNFQLSNVILASFSYFSSTDDADAVEKFFSQHDSAPYAASLRQGLDAVRAKAGWVIRDGKDVHQWLVDNAFV